MTARLIDTTSGVVLAENLETADTAWSRMKGLLGRSELPAGHGLLIAPCSSIHMFFMKFAIDAVFVDHGLRVLKVCSRLQTWRLASCLGAYAVFELPAGSVDTEKVKPGDLIRMEEAG